MMRRFHEAEEEAEEEHEDSGASSSAAFQVGEADVERLVEEAEEFEAFMAETDLNKTDDETQKKISDGAQCIFAAQRQDYKTLLRIQARS